MNCLHLKMNRTSLVGFFWHFKETRSHSTLPVLAIKVSLLPLALRSSSLEHESYVVEVFIEPGYIRSLVLRILICCDSLQWSPSCKETIRTLMKCHQLGCLNKVWKRTTPIDMLMWERKSPQGLILKNCRKLMLRSGERVFPREEQPPYPSGWLSNAKS